MYYVYLLENKDGKIYIGFTSNIVNRLESHNTNISGKWTTNRGPWKLIYTEEFSLKTEAIKREKFLKNLKSGQRLKQILHINIPA